jgi:hypothetical protein
MDPSFLRWFYHMFEFYLVLKQIITKYMRISNFLIR